MPKTKRKKKGKRIYVSLEKSVSPDVVYFNEQYRKLAMCFPADVTDFILNTFDDISDFDPLLKYKYRFCLHLPNSKDLNDYGGLLKIIYSSYPIRYDITDLYRQFRKYKLPVEWFAKEIGDGIFIKQYIKSSTKVVLSRKRLHWYDEKYEISIRFRCNNWTICEQQDDLFCKIVDDYNMTIREGKPKRNSHFVSGCNLIEDDDLIY